jgi:hypothetical protein
MEGKEGRRKKKSNLELEDETKKQREGKTERWEERTEHEREEKEKGKRKRRKEERRKFKEPVRKRWRGLWYVIYRLKHRGQTNLAYINLLLPLQ